MFLSPSVSPVQCVLLILAMAIPVRVISFRACAMFQRLYSVRTFQFVSFIGRAVDLALLASCASWDLSCQDKHP